MNTGNNQIKAETKKQFDRAWKMMLADVSQRDYSLSEVVQILQQLEGQQDLNISINLRLGRSTKEKINKAAKKEQSPRVPGSRPGGQTVTDDQIFDALKLNQPMSVGQLCLATGNKITAEALRVRLHRMIRKEIISTDKQTNSRCFYSLA